MQLGNVDTDAALEFAIKHGIRRRAMMRKSNTRINTIGAAGTRTYDKFSRFVLQQCYIESQSLVGRLLIDTGHS